MDSLDAIIWKQGFAAPSSELLLEKLSEVLNIVQNGLDQISGLVKRNEKLNKNVNLYSFQARKNFLVPKVLS